MFSPTSHKKIFFTISIVLIVASIALLCVKGLNLGIDFTGGNIFQFDLGKSVTVDMENSIEKLVSDCIDSTDITVQKTEDTQVIIKTPELSNTVSDEVVESVKSEFGLEQSAVMNNEKVNGTVSGQLIGNTLIAVLIAVVLMLLYITIRFDFMSGTSAVIALVHDIIIMFGFQSLLGVTVNTTFVAAVLTILGYSINATIIVFDRIRENKKLMKGATPGEIADAAIKSSYTRTINSSITTLFTIGALCVMGVTSIREFAIPIIVGIVCGTYSSLFISGPFWAWWNSLGTDKKPAKKKK